MPERDQVIQEAIAKALSLIDEADKAKNAHEPSYPLLIWKAAAEAEYVASQISITRRLSDFDSSNEVADPQDPLRSARNLLLDVQPSLATEPRRAYQSARNAVSVLRKVYVGLEKVPALRAAEPPPENE